MGDLEDIEAMLSEQHVMIDDMRRHLQRIDADLQEVMGMVRPVHDHADWVNKLRERLHFFKIVSDTPKISDDLDKECSTAGGNDADSKSTENDTIIKID
tara:strand:- start:55 stop:351 length:297 start_codon:yes stop_codon:yes gene_type:complete